jgi:hypothetical protein
MTIKRYLVVFGAPGPTFEDQTVSLESNLDPVDVLRIARAELSPIYSYYRLKRVQVEELD